MIVMVLTVFIVFSSFLSKFSLSYHRNRRMSIHRKIEIVGAAIGLPCWHKRTSNARPYKEGCGVYKLRFGGCILKMIVLL